MIVLAALLAAACVAVWPRSGSARPGAEPPAVPHATRRRPGRRRRRQGPGAEDWVADLAEVTAVGLRAGLDLPAAALVGSRSPAVARAAPWLEPRLLASAGEGVAGCLGGGPPAVTTQQAADLEVLGRAWRLSEESGAAASATTAAAALAVRSRSAARARTAAVLAGPRASMRLLTALPLAGPLVGLLLGLDPATLYGSGPARLAAATGLGLTGFGWWWSSRSIVRAQRPGRTGGDA